MDDKEYDLFKKIASLEVENNNLKLQVDELKEDSNNNQINDIYEKSKQKLYKWIAGILVIFSLFGFISINKIVEKIELKILEEGQEKVVDKLTSSYIKKHTSKITDSITRSLKPAIDEKIVNIFDDIKENIAKLVNAEVERNVREQLIATFKNVEASEASKTSKTIESSGSSKYIDAIEKTYEDNKYWVIAASSVLRSDVDNELERVKRKIGPSFEDDFPNVEITYPYPGTNHYPLVLGSGLPYKAANELRKKAIKAGFRDDTFLWKAKEY